MGSAQPGLGRQGPGRRQAPASESSLGTFELAPEKGSVRTAETVGGGFGCLPNPRAQALRPTVRHKVPVTFVHPLAQGCSLMSAVSQPPHQAMGWV